MHIHMHGSTMKQKASLPELLITAGKLLPLHFFSLNTQKCWPAWPQHFNQYWRK